MKKRLFHLCSVLLVIAVAGTGCIFDSTDDPADTPPPVPEVVGFSPEDGETQVGLDDPIVVVFSVAMDAASVLAATTFDGVDRTPVPFTISWLGNAASINPDEDLAHNTEYTLTIGTGALSAEDVAMAQAFTLTFSTETTWPVVVTTLPEDGATDIPLNVLCRVEFSQWMDPLSTEAAFSIDPVAPFNTSLVNDDILEVNFTSDLDASTLYTVTIDASAENDWGEAMIADHVFSFTTGTDVDLTPPSILSMTPFDGETGVATDLAEILIEFSELIDEESFQPTDIDMRLMMSVMGGNPDSDPEIYWVGNTMHIPLTGLPAGVELFVDFAPYMDLAGNWSADPGPWTFATAGTPEWFPSGGTDWWINMRYGEDGGMPWSEPHLKRVENVAGSDFDMNRYRPDYGGSRGGPWDPTPYIVLSESWHHTRTADAIELWGMGHESEGGLWEEDSFTSAVDWLRLPPTVGTAWDGIVNMDMGEETARVNYGGEVLLTEDLPWNVDDGPPPVFRGGPPEGTFPGCAKVEIWHQLQVEVEPGDWVTRDEGTETIWYCAGVGVVKHHTEGTYYPDEGPPEVWSDDTDLMFWYVAP